MSKPKINYRPTREERFWRWVDMGEPDECWLWAGSTNDRGYGYGPSDWAHRLAYQYTNGAIEQGEVIRHTCDNPTCVNPRHLITGTQIDNLRDMTDRHRSNTGIRHWNVKLSDDHIRAIRESADSSEALSAIYGVTSGTIRKIRRGERWKHVKGPDGMPMKPVKDRIINVRR